MRIRDVYPGSRILESDFYLSRISDLGSRIQQQQKRRGKIISFLIFFCSQKFSKMKIILFIKQVNWKNLDQFTKNCGIFYPKKIHCHQALKSWLRIWDPRSGIRKKLIWDPGSRDQKSTGSWICNTDYRSELQIFLNVMTTTLSAGPQLTGGGHCAQHHQHQVRAKFLSGMFIPDPTFFHPGCRISDPNFSIPHPGSTSKNSSTYFNPKKCFFMIRILIFYPSLIPDPGVKKRHRIPDPGPQHWLN